MAAGEEYTIDELAREAGTTVRSLRVYHERGVLPPPQVKGRTGFYGPDHLNRVRTITRLLDRGIKLNGIRELLNAWDRGDDLADVLGVGERLEATPETPWSAPSNRDSDTAAETVSATELEERYRDTPNGLARIVSAGLYEPLDAMTYRARDAHLIHIVDQIVGAGISRAEVVDELERVRADCDRMARRFVDLFDRTALEAFRRSPRTTTEISRLTAQVAVSRVVPGQVVGALVNHFVGEYLDHDTGDLVSND